METKYFKRFIQTVPNQMLTSRRTAIYFFVFFLRNLDLVRSSRTSNEPNKSFFLFVIIIKIVRPQNTMILCKFISTKMSKKRVKKTYYFDQNKDLS
jgi:hypothetical protein